MKKNVFLHFVILFIVGQVLASLIPQILPCVVFFRSIIIVLVMRLASDFLGRFVFKFPSYDWIYFRDYLKEGLFPSLGMDGVFIMFWSIILSVAAHLFSREFMLSFPDRSPMGDFVVSQILGGGVLPACYVMFFEYPKMQRDEKKEKRMRKKMF